MPTPSTLQDLETRLRALELEYARLNERLRTVGAALGGTQLEESQTTKASGAKLVMPAAARQSGTRTEPASKAAARPPASQTAPSPSAAAKSTPSKKAAPDAKAMVTTRAAQAAGPRKWFEKGEALALFGKILERPMPTRDLMVRVVAAKRKAQLPKPDLERFKWAVHSALKEAIGNRAIVRQRDGLIAMTRAGVRSAARASSKATA
jgi:hypothetical protein